MSKTVLTPAEHDLKVKDRKPDVAPKVGDLVKIKSRKWYEKWKSGEGNVYLPGNVFTLYMASHCGCYRTISHVAHGDFMLKEDAGHNLWSPEFFEEVFPVGEVVDLLIDSVSTIDNILSGPISASDFPTISHLSGYGGMRAEEAIKPFTVKDLPVIHFTDNSGAEEPLPLKTIKRKQFIKIKNL